MQANNEPSLLLSLVPVMLMSFFIAIGSYLLAKDKGRNVPLWTILGAIPFINFIFVWYFVGAANLRLERKIDELAASVEALKQRA